MPWNGLACFCKVLIAEILLKVALNTINQIFSLELIFYGFHIAIRVKSPFQLVVFDNHAMVTTNYDESLELLYPFITNGRLHHAYSMIFKKNTR
jgi:hypothetical protein